MATLEQLDGLLAEALQCLDDSARFLRELPELELNQNLRHLGDAINSAWLIREQIHMLRPDIKPDFVTEYENDRVRYDELSAMSRGAHACEDAGQLLEARTRFLRLRTSARSGYFRMVAEAGLFRLSERSSVGGA